MPNSHITPPETQYEVHIDEFMKAVRGEPFAEGNGLYRMKGNEIKLQNSSINDYPRLEGEQEYVVLIESHLPQIEGIRLECSEPVNYSVGFVFYKSIISKISIENTITSDWFFLNSHAGEVYITAGGYSGDINILENSHLNDINIFDNGCSGDITITGNSHLGDINIFDSGYSGNINVIGGHSGDIVIFNKSHSGNIGIWENSQTGDISIAADSQSGNISVDNNLKPMTITIASNSQTGNLDFRDAKLSYVTIEDNYFGIYLHNTQFLMINITRSLIAELQWHVGSRGELYISQQSKLLYLQITNASLLKDSVLAISDTELQYSILEEVLVQGNFLLRKLTPPTLFPFSWRNISTYTREEPNDTRKQQMWKSKQQLLEEQSERYEKQLTALKEKYGEVPLFRISHSSLGKTEITGSQLSGYRFEYLNSKLLDCFITGTELPKETITVYNPHPKTKLNYKDQYEQKTSIYNQFKKIYENQGDVVEASEYHAYAMRYQQKLLWWKLRHESHGFWKKVKLLFENIGFRFNWFSNNHGESWLIAFIFTITVSLLFFTASIWALTNPWDWWSALDRSIHKLPGFMLPTHAVDYLSKDFKVNGVAVSVNLWHTTWDFLGRLFIGYGFFQFIAAFRRHGKKGG